MIISDHRIKNEQKQDRDVSFDPFSKEVAT